MANIKSQTKRIDVAARNNKINVARKSELKTATKKVEEAVKRNEKEVANAALKEAIALLDRYSQLGTLTVNSAKRKKAHLTKLVNGLE